MSNLDDPVSSGKQSAATWRVATHARPDPDAVVSVYLAERYLFPEGEPVVVVFVPRRRPSDIAAVADGAVDVWNTYDPERRLFDHKPPAFADRNETCATKLVWEYLCKTGKPVGHLAPLIQAVHEGDRNPPGKGGTALALSRREGFHAEFTRLRPQCSGDKDLYALLCDWLDKYSSALREGAIHPFQEEKAL